MVEVDPVPPQAGIFISCPGDAEALAQRAIVVIERLKTAIDPSLGDPIYWKKDFDTFGANAAGPTQLQIARTSWASVDPIFVILSDKLGTPVSLPDSDRREMRARLDAENFADIRILDDTGFRTLDDLTPEQVPLTGTLFELFDACLRPVAQERGAEWTASSLQPLKQVRLIFTQQPARRPGQPRTEEHRWFERFRSIWQTWRSALTTEALAARDGIHLSEAEIAAGQGLDDMIETALREALGLPMLDPAKDDLPGLEAVGLERLMLFGGRADSLADLQRQVFADPGGTVHRPVIALVGESGAGKSSLLRAGLLGAFRRRLETRRGELRALVIEPRALAQGGGDPVAGLVEALCGDAGERAQRHRLSDPTRPGLPSRRGIDGPYPERLPGLRDRERREAVLGAQPGPLAVLQAIDQALPEGSTHLVLAIDQFEQIEADAREIQRRRQEESGEPVPLTLEEPWTRLLRALAVLVESAGQGAGSVAWSDTLEIGRLLADPAVAAVRDRLAGRLRVTMILAIQRPILASLAWLADTDRDALDGEAIHELEAMGLAPFRLAPIAGRRAIGDTVSRAFDAYGFRGTEAIAAAIEEQALDLVGRSQTVAKLMAETGDDKASDRDEIKQTAALPLIAITLVQILDAWRTAFAVEGAPGQGVPPPDRMDLDRWISKDGVDVAAAIETAGEKAIGEWKQDARDRDGAERGLLRAQSFERELDTRFSKVVDRLALLGRSVAGEREEVVLLDADRSADPVLVNDSRLLRALERGRLALPIQGDWVRLTHAVIFEHWWRLDRWKTQRRDRFAWRQRIDQWRRDGAPDIDDEAVTALVGLVLDWPGSGLGRDGDLRRYGVGLLIDRHDWRSPLAEEDAALRWLLIGTLTAAPRDDRIALLDRLFTPHAPHPTTAALCLTAVASTGDSELTDRLLNHYGTDPNQVDEPTGLFPLLMAVENGHAAVVEALLARGAEPNTVDPIDGTFPLLQAAQNGHAAVVEALLACGAEPNTVNQTNGTFPLLMAAQNGHVAVVEALLARGATADRAHADGATPLLVALGKAHLPTADRLIAHGARLPPMATHKRWAGLNLALHGLPALSAALLQAGIHGDPDAPVMLWSADWPPRAIDRLPWMSGPSPDDANDAEPAAGGRARDLLAAVRAALTLEPAEPERTLALGQNVFCARQRVQPQLQPGASVEHGDAAHDPALVLCAFIGPQGIALADGQGGLIRSVTRTLPPWPDAAAALNWALLLCSLVNLDGKGFLPVPTADDLPLSPNVDPAMMRRLDRLIEPPRVAPGQEGSWIVELCMLYGTTLFRSRLECAGGGAVTMVDDRPLVSDLPVRPSPRPVIIPKDGGTIDRAHEDPAAEPEGDQAPTPTVPGLSALSQQAETLDHQASAEAQNTLMGLLQQDVLHLPMVSAMSPPVIDRFRFPFWTAATVHAAAFWLMEDDGANRLPARVHWLEVSTDSDRGVLPIPWGDDGLDRCLIDTPLDRPMMDATEMEAWAGLVLVMAAPSDHGPRRPIGPATPLPLLDGQDLPPMAWREEDWRRPNFTGHPDGTVVILSWLEGKRLMRGQVLVPRTGRGAHILSAAVIHDNLPVWQEILVGPLRLQVTGPDDPILRMLRQTDKPP